MNPSGFYVDPGIFVYDKFMSPLQQDCIVYVSYSQFSGEKSIKACRISSRTLRKGLRYLMEKVNKMSANTLFLTKCHSNLCPKLSDIE